MTSIADPLRFYPPWIPSFKHEPKRETFDIVSSGDEAGLTLVARRTFRAGGAVFAMRGVLLPSLTLRSIRIQEGWHLHDPFFYGYLAHACNPNLTFELDGFLFRALSTIHTGDELTWNYEETETRLAQPFRCRCGSPECRKTITGSVVD